MKEKNQDPIRVMRIIARMNVGGPAVQVSGLMRGFDSSEFDHRLFTGFCATDEADAFDTMSEARTALDWSGEQGGTVEVLPSANYAA